MLTTPMVARFQSSALSSSATETLKLVRSRSFRLRTTWRRSLIDCAASMWSSSVRKAIGMEWSVASGQRTSHPPTTLTDHQQLFLRDYFRRDASGDKGFDHVMHLDVAVIRDRDAALHSVGDFLRVVFETAERSNLAFEDHHVDAQQAHFSVALDRAIHDATTCH